MTVVDPVQFELAAALASDAQLVEIERAVVASVLLDARVLRLAADEVTGSDFSDPRLGAIWEGFFRMVADDEPIDVLTVGGRLAEWGVRGIRAEQLHAWMAMVPSSASVAWYAAKVREYAIRRTVSEAGIRLAHSMQAPESSPAALLSGAIDSLRALQGSHVAHRVAARPLGSVLVGSDDYDWVVEGLLERRDRLMLTGSEGGGKTTLLRQVAISAAAGLHPFTGRPARPVRVLVVDAENSELQWRREARRMVELAQRSPGASADPGEALQLACVNRVDLTRDADLGMLHKLVDEHAPDLLFIGPLYRLIPRAINSDDDAAPLLAALDTLRDRGVALVIEAHAGHAVGAGGDRDMRPRGSSALLGWPEFGLGLRPDRSKESKGSNEFQLVRWRGDRDRRAWPTRIARGVSDWPWTNLTRTW